MEKQTVIQRLRRFLLAVVAAIFIGSIFELILLEHHQETLQWIPFIVSIFGLFAVAAIWLTPGKLVIRIFRWVMGGIALSSIVGVWLHFYSNLKFTREINPSFSLAESIWPAMKGSHPLLAPGILFLAGILGIAVTWISDSTN